MGLIENYKSYKHEISPNFIQGRSRLEFFPMSKHLNSRFEYNKKIVQKQITYDKHLFGIPGVYFVQENDSFFSILNTSTKLVNQEEQY